MRQREFTYTPRENKEHPKFLPVINMTQVVETLDYWCEENIRVKNGDPGLPDIGVDAEGLIDGREWCSIQDHAMDFLKSHPELSIDSIKEWILGVSN